MAGSRRSKSKGDVKKFNLESPTWPDACPTKHTEKVMSIITGNTHLNWAVHEGESNGFTPILFWRTPPLHPDERNDDPCEVLARHLPPQAHSFVFGDTSMAANKANAAAIAAMRRVPAISIYVISTNETNENAVGFLFQDVPSRIFKLRTSDFFDASAEPYETMGVDRAATLRGAITMNPMPSLVIDAGTALTYTGMDRSGKIIGGGICPGINSRFRSLHDYCGALPRIEFEEYKKFVEKMQDANDVAVSMFSKNTKEQIMVNVFTEIAFKCRCTIHHFLKIVGEAGDEGDEEIEAAPPEATKPTSENAMDVSPSKPAPKENGTGPTLKDPPVAAAPAAAAAAGSDADKTADSGAAPMDTEPTPDAAKPAEKPASAGTPEAAKKPADTQEKTATENGKESAAKPAPKEAPGIEALLKSNAIPSVTITGGDAAFLEMLLNLKNLGAGPISGIPNLPETQKYEIRSVKHLIHYGICAVLNEKFQMYDLSDPDQELRQKLIGLRVAKKFDQPDKDGDPVFRGSVMFIKSEETKDRKKSPPLDTDLFNIRYDDGDTEDVTLVQLYTSLVYYQEVGEKISLFKTASSDDIARKKEQAAQMSEALVSASPVINEAKERYEKEKAVKEAKAAAEAEAAKAAAAAKRSAPSASSPAPPSAKKAKKSAQEAVSPKKVTKESFIGRRVAKLFPMEDEKGNPIKVVFFGVIDKIVEDSDDSLWHVTYDDDDEEEYDEKDVKRGLRLYEKEKAADKNANK